MEIGEESLLQLNDFSAKSEISNDDFLMIWKETDSDPSRIKYSNLVTEINKVVLGGFKSHLFINDFGASTLLTGVPNVGKIWLDTSTNQLKRLKAGGDVWELLVQAGIPAGQTDKSVIYICDRSVIPTADNDLNVYSICIKGVDDFYILSKVKKTPRMAQISQAGGGNAVTIVQAKTNTSYDITGTVNELNVQSFENSFETETLISWNAGASPSLTMAAGMIMVSNIILQPNKRTVMVISRNTYALGQG